MRGTRSISRRVAIAAPALLLLLFSLTPSAYTFPQGIVELKGEPSDPFQEAHGKIVVLLSVRADCRIFSRYTSAIQELSTRRRRKPLFFLCLSDSVFNHPVLGFRSTRGKAFIDCGRETRRPEHEHRSRGLAELSERHAPTAIWFSRQFLTPYTPNEGGSQGLPFFWY
jgi:hypothetical protein